MAGSRRPRFRWLRWLLLLLLVLFAWVALAPGLSGVRYGISSVLRPDADYARLEAERAALPQRESAGEKAPEPAPLWTEYRGPGGAGVVEATGLDLDWSAGGPPELWRVAVGRAYSSVVVAGGLAITMEQRGDREVVVAFDRRSGALAWEHGWTARFDEPLSKEGPRATPAVAGDVVIALGATGELRGLELATGEERWRQGLLGLGKDENLYYGLAASPRVAGELVVVLGGRSAFAFETETGELRWSALEEAMAYATPVVTELLGDETVLVATATRVVALDPETGEERWSTPWAVENGLTCTQPVPLGEDRVLLSSGYGKGSALVQLAREGDRITATQVWSAQTLKTRFNEPVVTGGHAYGFDEGILSCVRVEDGRRVWKDGRYGYGQLLLVGDRLLVLDDEGRLRAVAADTGGLRELGSFDALEGTELLNVPALVHGLLYVRSDTELVCYDLTGAP